MVSQRTLSTAGAREVGDALGVDWARVDVEQFRMGMELELEHGVRNVVTRVTSSDLRLTGRIALAHLTEFPDYYARLPRREDEARAAE